MRPFALARSLAAGVLAAATLAACGSDTPSGTTTATSLTPSSLSALSGSGQTGTVGSALTTPLVVQVTTSTNAVVAGVGVTFQVTSGTATLSAATATTDASGQARTDVTLGSTAGGVVVSATVTGTSLTTSFTLTAVSATASTSCAATGAPSATTLAAGGATTPTGSSLCLSGGTTGAEYALVPNNASTSARASLVVTAADVDAVASTLTNAVAAGALGTLGASASVSPRDAFERRLRASAATELTPKLAAARSWYAARRGSTSARLNVIPASVSVGSLVSLNANADDACTKAQMRGGRVAAVSSRAIIVADTLNPSNGYTDADYASFANSFDTLVDAVDRKNFGDPTDIDGNGHVVIFFTSAVNALTPKDADYYIGGFFYGRDLFPTTANALADACASSNTAEMFYLMVPDPSGTINGNVFSKSFVTSEAIATLAHEYQHLINSSRRMYINTAATDFEETWLDEGLAHVAEELVFYQESGLASRQNIDVTKLRSTTAYRTAFNNLAISNFGRLESYLDNPTGNSPYADNDSLATRGATWSLLRWAADHATTDEASVWYALVNSAYTGRTNLRQVFGTDPTVLARDWATSLLLDDVAGADARYLEPSWNLRSVFGALTTPSHYPLSTVSLASGTPSTVSLSAGGTAYLRFAVGAGKTGSVSWTTTSSNIGMTLVRLK